MVLNSREWDRSVRHARRGQQSADSRKEEKMIMARARKEDQHDANIWELRLYVAGQTPKSLAAFANLKKICEEYMPGKYRIEVIDLLENPRLAKGDQILAIPTLVRKLPEPVTEDNRRPFGHRKGSDRARPAAFFIRRNS